MSQDAFYVPSNPNRPGIPRISAETALRPQINDSFFKELHLWGLLV